jgi:hypothetical protein
VTASSRDEVRYDGADFAGDAARRLSRGAVRLGHRDERKWRARRGGNWIAPALAAAAVIALAVSLVVMKDAPNGGGGTPAGPVPGISGVPRYFVELTAKNRLLPGLLVGDTFTGRKVATIAAPAGMTFTGVSAAADDRSFVVDGSPAADPLGSRTFYLLRIDPGSAVPAQLTRLPIAPVADATGMALSRSGRELAVTIAGSKDTLRIYSVATGRQLRAWSASGDFGLFSIARRAEITDLSGLSWVDGDRAVVFPVMPPKTHPHVITSSIRRLEVSAAGDNNLTTASRVIFTERFPGPRVDQVSCVDRWLMRGDGRAIVCATNLGPPLRADFQGYVKPAWLVHPIVPAAAPRTLYQSTLHLTKGDDGFGIGTLWANQAGDTLLVYWYAAHNIYTIVNLHFGVISHGRYTPLPGSLFPRQTQFYPPLVAAW